MNKKLLIIAFGAMALVGCTDHGMGYDYDDVVKENAENVFGLIDPKQDWSNITSSSITVTADANLQEIAKVQILTESPFFNDEAQVLAEADVTKGQTVTIDFDAPRGSSRLIAACVDSKGHYYVKGFNLGDKNTVSFKKTSAARTRSVDISELPNFSKVGLTFSNSYQSYNAGRTRSANVTTGKAWSQWKGTGWENERLWKLPDTGTNGAWTFANGTIYKNADTFTAEEKTELIDIFNTSLFRYEGNTKRKQDNLKYITESSAVKFFDNHLITDGKSAITLIPVNLISTEAYMCDIYYYYFKEVPAGMSKIDYIKTLPKFKAVDCEKERDAYKAVTGINKASTDTAFLKLHEYLLPYYGDPSDYTVSKVALSAKGFKTDGKFYRIRNAESGMYFTYTDEYKSSNRIDMMKQYADDDENIAYQTFQLFKGENNRYMFYNVGSKQFFKFIDGKRPDFSDEDSEIEKFIFVTADAKNNVTDATTGIHLLSNDLKQCIKCAESTSVAVDPNRNDRVTIQWTFEEYTPGRSLSAVSEGTLNLWPSVYPTPKAVFDEGYKIGIMLRKGRDTTVDDGKMGNSKNGCMYSYGAMNTEINTFGQFNTAVKDWSMKLNSPRIAMFNANNKTYLTFEDGSDCNFSDIIVELGGQSVTVAAASEAEASTSTMSYTTTTIAETTSVASGVYMFDDVVDPGNIAFTMCFEDRPIEADYDMNDVVLRCVRLEAPNKFQLSVIAVGADDRVEIQGIPGKCLTYMNLNGAEVHELFGVQNETGNARFINTVSSDKAPVSPASATYEVDPSMTIPQFLSQIYIKNLTMNRDIRVPKVGEPPLSLIIPGDFNYPREGQRISFAYGAFLQWSTNASNYGNWLNSFEPDKVIVNPTKYFGSYKE